MSFRPNAVASSSKTHQTSHHHRSKSSSKHRDLDKAKSSKPKKKSKEKRHGDQREKGEKSRPFEHRLSSMRLSVAPKFSADWLIGVREALDGMLMR